MQESLASSHPVVVHPTYCVEERLWFTDEGVTARSLAALAIKLGKDKTIADYFPNGFDPRTTVEKPKPVIAPWDEPLPERFTQPTITEDSVAPLTQEMVSEILKRETMSPHEYQQEYNTQAELPLPEPSSSEEPIKDFGPVKFTAKRPKLPAPPKVVQAPIGTVHKLPDGRVDWGHPENLERLRALMLVDKLKVIEVARRFGVTKNVIIGACHRKHIPISDR